MDKNEDHTSYCPSHHMQFKCVLQHFTTALYVSTIARLEIVQFKCVLQQFTTALYVSTIARLMQCA